MHQACPWLFVDLSPQNAYIVAFCGREEVMRGELGIILLPLIPLENRRRELLA